MPHIDRQIENPPARFPTHRDYFSLLARHFSLLVFVVTLTVLLTYLGLASQPAVYQADLTLDLGSPAGASAQYHATQTLLLTTTEPIQGLEVSRAAGNPLVHLRYRSVDRQLASDVVSGVARSYLDIQKRGQVASQDGLISQLQQALAQATADRVTKETAYDSIKTGSLAALLASPDGAAMRKPMERRNALQGRLTDMRQTLGEHHPDYQSALARLRQLNDEIASARAAMVEKAASDMIRARRLEKSLREKKVGNAPVESPPMGAEARIVNLRVAALPRGLGRTCLLAGFMTALPVGLLILLVGSADTRVRSLTDLQRDAGFPVLSVLPVIGAWANLRANGPHLLGSASSEARYGEALESLGAGVMVSLGVGNRSLAITSPLSAEGRSTLAANLAVSLGKQGNRILLIDGDRRRPGLSSLFAPPTAAAAAQQPGAWRDVVLRSESQPFLHVLPLHKVPDDVPPTRILAEAACDYDVILVDSPPFLHFPEAVDLVQAVDSVVVMVRAKRTTEEALNSLLGYLGRLNSKVAGIVVNGV